MSKKERNRRYRDRHPERVKASWWRWKEERTKLRLQLKSGPCADCGGEFPAVCMDFDHVRGEKVSEVARLLAMGSVTAILAEIEKCDLVCSNCHRIRTARRRGEEI